MKSPDLATTLDQFPAHKLRSVLLIVRCLRAHREKGEWSANLIFSLPMGTFVNFGIRPVQVKEAIEVFQEVHKQVHSKQNLKEGILSQPLPSPEIKIEGDEEVVKGLVWVSVDELEQEISKREGDPTGGNKISICYDLQEGIYDCGSKEHLCSLTKEEYRFLQLVHSQKYIRLKAAASKLGREKSNVSATRRSINNKFKKGLRLSSELICLTKSVGYHLNTNEFTISGR